MGGIGFGAEVDLGAFFLPGVAGNFAESIGLAGGLVVFDSFGEGMRGRSAELVVWAPVVAVNIDKYLPLVGDVLRRTLGDCSLGEGMERPRRLCIGIFDGCESCVGLVG